MVMMMVIMKEDGDGYGVHHTLDVWKLFTVGSDLSERAHRPNDHSNHSNTDPNVL